MSGRHVLTWSSAGAGVAVLECACGWQYIVTASADRARAVPRADAAGECHRSEAERALAPARYEPVR